MAGYQRHAVHGDGLVAGQAAVHIKDIAVAALLGGGVDGGVGPEPAELQHFAERGHLRLVDLLHDVHDVVELRLDDTFVVGGAHRDLEVVGGQEARAVGGRDGH